MKDYKEKIAKDYNINLKNKDFREKNMFLIDSNNNRYFYNIENVDFLKSFDSFDISFTNKKPLNYHDYIKEDFKRIAHFDKIIDDMFFSPNSGLNISNRFSIKFYKNKDEASFSYNNLNVNAFPALKIGLPDINNEIVKYKKITKMQGKNLYVNLLIFFIMFLIGIKLTKKFSKKDKIERTKRFMLSKTVNSNILLLEDKSKCNKNTKTKKLKQKIIL